MIRDRTSSPNGWLGELRDRVLDVGCRGGFLAPLLGAMVTGSGQVIDVDPSIESSPLPKGGHLQTSSSPSAPPRSSTFLMISFDVVTSTLAVHHVPEAERPAAFADLDRVTRPGGPLLVADFRPTRLHRAPAMGRVTSQQRRPEELSTDAGFHMEGGGVLPLLDYVRPLRPDRG
jgi:SAM-dependent methyltransferase